MKSGSSDQEGSDEVPGNYPDNNREYEVLYEECEIESVGVFSGGSIGQVPDREPRSPDRKGRTYYSEKVNEYEIEDYIEHESDSEDFHSFLDSSDSGENLEVNLKEEIEYDKESRVLKNNPRHSEFFTKKYSSDDWTEDEHKHSRNHSNC